MLPYESQLLTLFLHCVSFSFVWAFYYLKQIGKQNRREQIATFDCVCTDNHTIKRCNLLSAIFIELQKMVTIVTQHLSDPVYLPSLPHPSYQFS